MKKVPTVNIQEFTHGSAKEQTEFVARYGAGLKEFGFVVVEGHGIPTELIRKCYDLVKQFFALDEKTKFKYELENGKGQRGYTPFGREHAKSSNKGDLKEFWHVGRDHFVNEKAKKEMLANIWPDDVVPGFKENFMKLYDGLDGFSVNLLEATSEYIGLPRKALPEMIVDGNTVMRLIHYPPLAEEHFKSGAVRAAAHEDINFITILCEATDSGLELLSRDGTWLSVECEPGQMVIDSGDMLSRLCNDIIPSTTHRVVNPANAKNNPRYSMPFFVHPFSACELTALPQCVSSVNPPKYAPITAGEYLHQRLREIGLTK